MPIPNFGIDAAKAQIRSIETPRAEGHLGSQTGSKILNTPPANYHPGKK